MPMTVSSTVLLVMIAGLRITLGLLVARLRAMSRSVPAVRAALATGILVFLLWDILSQASEPIQAALDPARKGDVAAFATLLALFVVGIGVGLLGLVYFDRLVTRRHKVSGE